MPWLEALAAMWIVRSLANPEYLKAWMFCAIHVSLCAGRALRGDVGLTLKFPFSEEKVLSAPNRFWMKELLPLRRSH